jgi:hypothetical protein
MPETFYREPIYRLQDEILIAVKNADVGFYLTGKTALSRHYLNHRFSEDLDLFLNKAATFKEKVRKVRNALKETELTIQVATAGEAFVRMMLEKDMVTIKVDLVNDIEYHHNGFVRAAFFHKIDNWRNILSNKLCALSRLEVKDIADVIFIARNFAFDWPEIVAEGRQKDLWVDPIEIVKILENFPADKLYAIQWIEPVDMNRLVKDLKRLQTDIMLGRANSLFTPST